MIEAGIQSESQAKRPDRRTGAGRITPLQRYKSAQDRLKPPKPRRCPRREAKNELNALILFKHDMAEFQRMYAFLSQIFDYGNTAIEKRFIFYKRLLPLLEFGREREGIDLSKSHPDPPQPENQGKQPIALERRRYTKADPAWSRWKGTVQGRKSPPWRNHCQGHDPFEGELTEDDRLVYVNNVKGKLLESKTLVQQAANNTKSNLPTTGPSSELMNAIIDAFAAHSTMSKQALDSEGVCNGLKGYSAGSGATL